jgi:uncharacterized protein with von Willebrand factor type A (vWA) domain
MEDMLRQLRQRRQEQLERYDLGGVVEDIRRKLDEVVSKERAGIQRRRQEAQGQARSEEQAQKDAARITERMTRSKEAFLDQLPRDLGGKVKQLSDYEFMDPEAAAAFAELMAQLQRNVLDSFLKDLSQSVQDFGPEQRQELAAMLRDLNSMLQERARGEEPDFQGFMEKWGKYFPENPQSLDELLEGLQERARQMGAMLRSMSPEQRAQLQGLMGAVMEDEALRWEVSRLFGNLEQHFGPGWAPARYGFFGEEPLGWEGALDLMGEMQSLDQVEAELRAARHSGQLDDIDLERLRAQLGDEAAGSIEQLQRLRRVLEEAGYVEQLGDRLELTPRALRSLGQRALREIFTQLRHSRHGEHESPSTGRHGERGDESRPYSFGDPFYLDVQRTLMNALRRTGPGTPVRVDPSDFEVSAPEASTQAATVLMIDLSRSMPLRGNLLAAKKVALALHQLISSQFPRDALYIIGFADYARELKAEQLPRVSVDEWVYGTNMEHALMLARSCLARHKGSTRQIIMITDGEPTAHLENGEAIFYYPPLRETIERTLKEVMRCTRDRITINTFMLAGGQYLTAFVNELTRLNQGRAFFTHADRLGEYVMVDYLRGRQRRLGATGSQT